MITFLPLEDFYESLNCLDNKRLGKQRVESRTILKVLLENRTTPLAFGPYTKMWKGYERALIRYYNISLEIWESRGFKNEILQPLPIGRGRIKYPWWVGLKEFHDSHKSRLLFKDPIFYGKYGWNVLYDRPYFWPTHHKCLMGLKYD